MNGDVEFAVEIGSRVDAAAGAPRAPVGAPIEESATIPTPSDRNDPNRSEGERSRVALETLRAISPLSGPITLQLSSPYSTTVAMLHSASLAGHADPVEPPDEDAGLGVEETDEVRDAPLPFGGGLAAWIDDGDERTLAERVALNFLAGAGGALQQTLGLALVVPPHASVPSPPAASSTLQPASAEGRDGHETGIARPG